MIPNLLYPNITTDNNPVSIEFFNSMTSKRACFVVELSRIQNAFNVFEITLLYRNTIIKAIVQSDYLNDFTGRYIKIRRDRVDGFLRPFITGIVHETDLEGAQ